VRAGYSGASAAAFHRFPFLATFLYQDLLIYEDTKNGNRVVGAAQPEGLCALMAFLVRPKDSPYYRVSECARPFYQKPGGFHVFCRVLPKGNGRHATIDDGLQ
jgi:hypothetical protein